jgi:hypothetical protein
MRYMVERTFPDGLNIPTNDEGKSLVTKVVEKNGQVGVTWVQSFVTPDKKKTYCIYDGPNEQAVRDAAERNGLPIDSIVPVSVLDPYFYHS